MLKLTKIIIAILLSLSFASITAGKTSDPIIAYSPEIFKPVIIPVIKENLQKIIPPKFLVKRPQPEPKPVVIVEAPTRQDTSKTGILKGTATWYCKAGRSSCHYKYPDRSGETHYAAAGPKLRKMLGKNWRNKTVTVIKGDNSVDVKLIDYCGCHRGKPNERIIDLYADAFDNLGDLGRGHMIVRIMN